MVVDLTDNVLVSTPIASAHHAALRSGFSGYPANPRWNAAKFKAWKTGRQWREALVRGEMIVRSTDSMLVPATQREESSQPEDRLTEPPISPRLRFPMRAKQVLGVFHAV
ncbi:MAG TPA: hypothetical protein DDZ80_00500 [Cyanobacteria bacterium UBA8803]|nr:hypothetical protein [Cyanobacteria bacterium UBA9273]HBL57094.1 hypothetical protein [Cyanobacteria bacterium UBA8803]